MNGGGSSERPPTRPPSVDPIEKSIQSSAIQSRLTKHGPVVATSQVGCANCLRREIPSTIYGLIGRSLAVVPTADEDPLSPVGFQFLVSFVALRITHRPDRMEGPQAETIRQEGCHETPNSDAGERCTQPSDAILVKRYLELQRLRDEVRKAEISRLMDAPYSNDQTVPPYRAPNTA